MPDENQPVRLLNLGPTHWLRTQSVYRSTAALMSEDSPDTLVIGTPLHCYLAVGGGHRPEETVDLAACARLDIPVVSAPLSAAVTYADAGALVVQWISSDQSPGDLTRLLLDGFARALESLGMSQATSSNSRIAIGDRTLIESQTGTPGRAGVVQGDIFLQLDGSTARQFPGYEDRTYLWRELPRPVSPEMLVDALLGAFSMVLGRTIERSRPRQIETRLSKQIDLELLREAADVMKAEGMR